MVRRTPADRLEKLVVVAAAAFVEHGFQRTQMDDIADALGVSKGTVYRSIESKESLLAAVLTYADNPSALPADGPIESTDRDDLSAALRDQLARAIGELELASVLGSAPTGDLGSEVESIARDLYTMMAAHRVRIAVLDRCAPEVPELTGDWYETGRYAVVDMWIDYLASRAQQIRSSVGHEVLARTIVELITLWAVKMPWDPAPRPYSADMATRCAVMVRHLVEGKTT